ncbi:isocitrate lyase, partial [Fistulina hepatica ATCC 64428]
PLSAIMIAAEQAGKGGDALQAIEDAWVADAKLQLFSEALSAALQREGASPAKLADFNVAVKYVSWPEAVGIARTRFGLKTVPHWDWDAPRTREGFYRYRGGTQCAIVRANAFAPYADLLWMETKKP